MNVHLDSEAVIRLPQPMSAPPSPRIPIVAALAPVLVSVALFVITGSPMMLLFAVLGPVTAIASVADGALAGRRHTRRERARFDAELDAAAGELAAAHADELDHRRAASPSGARIAAADPRSSIRWSAVPDRVEVTIGAGSIRSAVRVEGAAQGDDLVAFARGASILPDAPVMADPSAGIAVAGPLPVAGAVARGLVIQVLARVPPGQCRIVAHGPAWSTAFDHAPHASAPPDPDSSATGRSGVDSVFVLQAVDPDVERDLEGGRRRARPVELARIEVAEQGIEAAATCATIITILPDGARVARAGRAGDDTIGVHPVDAEALAGWCEASASHAPRSSMAPASSAPGAVGLEEILVDRPPGAVAAVIGAGATGAVTVDLATQGPHAVVGGTTGSGKSELLLTWVASMAAGASPSDLAVLLIDFKGGAGFAPIAHLPHVVGVVTDLDEAGAMRAVGSLRAELRRREAVLAAAGAREHGQGLGLPRLVIVVDEYAALVETDPQLHAVFSDLAARGRSLGIHLIVGTQRPAASVRDAVLANADTRVCLRVRDRSDGIALVGSALPAELPAEPRGRAIVSIAGAPAIEVQVAIAGPSTIDGIRRRWAAAPRPARPWRDPLPRTLSRERLDALLELEGADPDAAIAAAASGDRAEGGPAGADGVIGLLDRPDRQSIEPWRWRPQRDGMLLAVGSAGCGRSGLLAAIAAVGPSIPISTDPASAWDSLADLADSRGDHGGATLLVDDLDLVLDRFDAEHGQAWLDRLVSVCRRRRELGIGIAVSSATLDGPVRSIEPHVTTRVLMRMQSRQDHRLAGGDASTWDPGLPPGGAIVDGIRAQVLLVDRAPRVGERARAHPVDDGPLAIVAADPRSVATRLQELGREVMTPEHAMRALAVGSLAPATVVVGDPVAWQVRWDALDAIGHHAPVLLHGLALSQVRAITGRRELPPPLPDAPQWCWMMLAPGQFTRAQLPWTAAR
jgi:S-DNA-T family DNA segregation ATPase FtsK/SpoIIIE